MVYASPKATANLSNKNMVIGNCVTINSKDNTFIMFLIIMSHFKEEYGITMSLSLQRGSTPLHLACRRHHVNIALLLLHSGCQFDIVDQVGVLK